MFGKILIIALLFGLNLAMASDTAGDTLESRRAEARRLMQLGNYRDAHDLYRALALDPANTPKQAVQDARETVSAKSFLDEEVEPFLAELRQAWPESWRVLAYTAAAQIELTPMVLPDDGYKRAYYWQGRAVNAAERDRVEAIRLMLRAEALLDSPEDPADDTEKWHFYWEFAEIVRTGREGGDAWRLTHLTDLEHLPEYGEYGPRYSPDERGAPVDDQGGPLFYHLPSSWDNAVNDGERWRWLLGKVAENGAPHAADWQLVYFLHSQFGVQTMGRGFIGPRSEEEGSVDTGPYAVRTLGEDETIARLATGLKRFTLPDEFNFIKILRRLSAQNDHEADRMLAQIFENRQQYPKAVHFWERALAWDTSDDDSAAIALRRITGKNGRLKSGPVEPAGRRTRIAYLFRNGSSVHMKAQRLDEKALLTDIRSQVQSNRDRGGNWYPSINRPERLGMEVVRDNQSQYILETTAEWDVTLEPLPDHYSSRTHIEMPFTGAGCYLVTATMEDGNESRVILWLADLAVSRKSAADKQIIFVADAVSGEPVSGATVTCVGYSYNYTSTHDFAEITDADGLVFVPTSRLHNHYLLTVAEAPDGRMAYLGFNQIWAESYDREDTADKAYVITDRPIYRPDQPINFKVWLGHASYSTDAPTYLASRPVDVTIHNPRGEKVYEKTLTTDARGGVADSLTLDQSAPLGAYTISIRNLTGYSSFRLEEYRKPEFEVTVEAPDKAIGLGDTATVKVSARYYFGAPVTNATVAYKVERTPYARRWYPPWDWDWLYGSGAWWMAYDYTWLPGWREWGMERPRPSWMPEHPYAIPELVAQGEAELDADGSFRLPIDTLPAKELFGHQDHRYAITVEVTDQSRRTIVGSGRVIASRAPFTVSVWADRGWYHVGQEMNVSLRVAAAAGGPVPASGTAVLYRLRYGSDGRSDEEEAARMEIVTDAGGDATFTWRADAPGQYRIACRMKDAEGREVEGGAVVTIRGEKGQGDFRYTALELVPDRRDYQPGDTVRLAVNSANPDAVVILFPRTERPGTTPIVIRLENGSHIQSIPVGATDQPNFFCDAITIADGKVHHETREIFVPPAQRTLNVEVTPDRGDYLPGGKANFTVTVADTEGRPVEGEVVVSLYDRSVEYITGGSNVPDIKAYFWQWKRHYSPGFTSSLKRYGYRVTKRGDVEWEPIGMFGAQEADWNDDMEYVNGAIPRNARGGMVMMDSYAAPSYAAAVPEAMPLPAPAMAADMAVAKEESTTMRQDAGAMTGGGEVMTEPQVRSEFADTALWIAALATDGAGRATFSLDMPENLTAWKARVWAMGPQTRVGEGESVVETKKNIIVRPQAPRFLTQKDQVILSANLHNYLPRAKSARAELVLEGGLLEAAEGVPLVQEVRLAANGETRVDWLVHARRPGEATVIMKLLTDEESDAAEISVPVLVHGSRRVEHFGGVLRSTEGETILRLRVPEERLPDRSVLELNVSPTIAGAMLDALPFLIEYPYGCTEQTLNRFLPVVMTRKYLESLGLSLADAEARAGRQVTDADSAAWLKKFGDTRARKSPVFDDAELTAMVKQGVERLVSMQCSDGGWGWFSGTRERSWPHTTAVVMHGLLTARDNGVAIPMGVLERGSQWLRAYRQQQVDRLKAYIADPKDEEAKQQADNLDAFIHLVLMRQGHTNPDMRDFLHRDRLGLSLSGLAMLGLALHEEGAGNFLPIVLQNLEQYVERDSARGTAHLRIPRRQWWWWYNDDIETQSWYLMLLSRIDPRGETTAGVAKYILQNRKNGTYWQSTRDSAYAIEALTRYATASGETSPDMTVTLFFDGRPVLERRITADNFLDDHRFRLDGLAVESGDHEIRIVRAGGGNLYFSGRLDLFSLEDPIAKAGTDLTVERSYYRLIRDEGTSVQRRATGQAGEVAAEHLRREPMPGPFADSGERVSLEPGDLVEVVLRIEAQNDYEYLVFEDMKAAGLESVELVSGYSRNALGAYIEYRDDMVVLFVRSLARGVYTVSYRFRAETPGFFSALPTFGGGMYATDLFCNSDEMKVRVVEKGVYEE